jgi:hypothetical protein
MARKNTDLAKKNLTKDSTVADKGVPDNAKPMPDNCLHPDGISLNNRCVGLFLRGGFSFSFP